jgi:D-amino-acid oxidase
MGLTCALRLARAGLPVNIVHAESSDQTVSSVAAAIWYPFLAEPKERTRHWAFQTYKAFETLAETADSGISMVDMDEVSKEKLPFPDWAELTNDHYPIEAIPEHDCPPSYFSGWRTRVPMIEMPRYLPWLEAQLKQQGVTFEERRITSLDELKSEADIIINCCGLGARTLLDDREMNPIRGQVLRVRGSGLNKAIANDDTNPPLYVLPRRDDVILGGSAVAGREDLEPDPTETEQILAGIQELIPDGQVDEILQVKVGLRPGRSSVRLERETLDDGTGVIHNYGHGGSGVTLSWGCAEEVLQLVKTVK